MGNQMKTPNRQFHSFQDDHMIILVEKTAHTPPGHFRRKWIEDRIAITLEELQTLAEKYLPKK